MERLLAELQDEFSLVIIDTPPTSVVSDAIPLTDWSAGFWLWCASGRRAGEAARTLKEQLAHLGAPPRVRRERGVERLRGYDTYNPYGTSQETYYTPIHDPDDEPDLPDFGPRRPRRTN